jgi:hypothetical protein
MHLTVDTHKILIQMPTPAGIGWMMNSALPDLRGELRAEPVPPEAHRLVADVDAALEKQILDLAQRQWLADVKHHREADHLR